MNRSVMKEHFKDRYLSFDNNLKSELTLPSSLNVELNNTCNQRCVFCPFHGSSSKLSRKPKSMDYETAKKILKEAFDLGIGKKELGFYMTGEPFLYPHLVDIIGYAKKIGFQYIYLTTNGGVAFSERIFDVVNAGLSSIRFSVNAPNEALYKEIHGKDDFSKVKKGIISLYEYRERFGIDLAISISCVITKKTRDIKQEMINKFEKYVDDIIFMPVIKYDGSIEDKVEDIYFENVIKGSNNYICRALFDSMYIDASGNVLLCCESYTRGNYIVAKWGEETLDKIWNMPLYNKYRKMFLDRSSLEGTICENCIIRLKAGQLLEDQ